MSIRLPPIVRRGQVKVLGWHSANDMHHSCLSSGFIYSDEGEILPSQLWDPSNLMYCERFRTSCFTVDGSFWTLVGVAVDGSGVMTLWWQQR